MSIPLVPLSAFRSLAGEELARELEGLAGRPELTELVLFSDPHGSRLALLPVGAGQRHAALADVRPGEEIDGLRPLCAWRTGEAAPVGGGGAGAGGAGDAALGEREREVGRLEATLKSRERYIAECEHRLAEVGQNLSEREAMLEQREQLLADKEREFFRRNGDATRRAAGGTTPPMPMAAAAPLAPLPHEPPPAPRADF